MPKSNRFNYNPFIHGTSSKSLAMMKHTDFQLMPVLQMLQRYKIAPMTGELEGGGFIKLGEGSNNETVVGAISFGRIHAEKYSLYNVLNYANRPTMTADTDKNMTHFNELLSASHKDGFSNMCLLMILFTRLKQSGKNTTDILSNTQMHTLVKRLDATIQLYYFIACIQKHIYIMPSEISRFKNDHNILGSYGIGDYILHFLSFETLIEKFKQENFNMESIYNDPSPENIASLLTFLQINKDQQEKVKRYQESDDKFVAKDTYCFFSSKKPSLTDELESRINYQPININIFLNFSSFRLGDYVEKYYLKYPSEQKEEGEDFELPDFENFYPNVISHLEALKERVRLFKDLLNANTEAFVRYDQTTELVSRPFPIIFLTEVNSIKKIGSEFRSCSPLKLGK